MKGNPNIQKANWLYYTVLVGLIPILFRIIIYLLLNNKDNSILFNETDFVAFGLVLNITNINRMEQIKLYDSIHKIRNMGISIIMITIFSLLFSLSILNQIITLFNRNAIIIASLILSIATLIFTIINFYLEKLEGK